MALPTSRIPPKGVSLVARRFRDVVVVLLLASSDLLAIGTAFMIPYGIRLLFGPLSAILYLRLLPALTLFPLAYLYAGLYPGYGLSPVEQLRLTFRYTTLVALILGSIAIFSKVGDQLSRPVILSGWLLTVILVPLVRALLRWILSRTSIWGQPVIILGAAQTGEVIIHRLLANPGLGLRPVACLDDDIGKHGSFIRGVPVVGSLRLARELARTHSCSRAIVAMPGLERARLTEVVEQLSMTFPHIITIPDLLGLTSLWVSARDIQGVLGLELRQNLLFRWNRFLKRTLDLAVTIPALVFIGPALLVLGGMVKLYSPGPAFYSQVREGTNGAKIRVWKIRTMVVNAEEALQQHLAQNPGARQEWEQFMKLRDDPRIVPVVGHLLRRLSLDELPQLWNVLRGDMSLVGPRPFPDYHLAKFSEHFRGLRRRATPGLTGLWQVSARSDGDLAVQEELDTYYIRNWSLWLDVYLLARTFTAVLFGSGAY